MQNEKQNVIATTDNNCGKCDVPSEDIPDLQKIADCEIGNLKLEDHPNLMVFPHDLHQYGDNIYDEEICSINQSGDRTILTTGNIMGFVGMNHTKLKIASRFEQAGGNDYFLHYMLQKVFAINLFDLKCSSTDEDVFDFQLYLFPYYLNKAMQQGLYKEYQTRHYNDAHLRGVIDIDKYIRKDIPFVGKTAYHNREYAYDNPVIQLIRHTIEYISQLKFANEVLRNSFYNTRTNVSQIIAATPSYNRSERQSILCKNLKHLRHPYYSNYYDLQRICLQILLHENLRYGKQNDEIYGILFDGAWLWEEYLFTILRDVGFKHPQNKVGKGGIYLFEKPNSEDVEQAESEENLLVSNTRYRRYPDYYKEDSVLDAKYKSLDRGRIDRDDMHQIISYMHVEQATHGGFISPSDKTMKVKLGTLRGCGGEVDLFSINVKQQVDNFISFCERIQKEERQIKDMLSLIKKEKFIIDK